MNDFEGPERVTRGRGTNVRKAVPQREVGQILPSPRPTALGVEGILHLQRLAGNASVVQMLAGNGDEERSPVLDVVGHGGGTPLDEGTRSSMEARFGGADFTDVRLHTDTTASRSAEAVGANAYTVGSDVVFQNGRYNEHTLAHELAHVAQQRQGPVDGTDAPGGIKLSDPADRFEVAAEDTATKVMAAPVEAAQREEEDAGAAAVQRESAPEEEEEESAG
jgi:hypothetical protein